MRLPSALSLILLVAAALPAARAQTDGAATAWIREAEEVLDGVDSYTAVFHKQERVNRTLRDEETVFLKFKKPFKVYMKWLDSPHKGREALYVEGWNDNRIMVHEGGILGIMTLSLDPKGSVAMRGKRHPITDCGLGNLVRIIAENVRRAADSGELEFKELGEESVYARRTRLVEVILPIDRSKGYYARRAEIALDEERKVPIRIRIYDWEGRLIERYGYENLRFNPGLTDADFDPKNPEYRF